MTNSLPEYAGSFLDLYRHVEHVLRRHGYCRPDRRKADVDWRKFAEDLGEQFFAHVCESQHAPTLIGTPPRAYHRRGAWQPKNPEPVRDAGELFVRGVCQVRNNIVHGEKFVVKERVRSDTLVKEAHWVLEQAIRWHPEAEKILSKVRSFE